MQKNIVRADLSTAQNSMFSFVSEALVDAEKSGKVDGIAEDSAKMNRLYQEVRQQVLHLMTIPPKKQSSWHIGIIDSGKRAIESIVSYFCPPEPGANVLVNTENYVAFNKFSAAESLSKQKEVKFLQPFNLAMGQALTIDSEAEMEKARTILRSNEVKTLWLAWNSTSTGVKEKVEDLVAYRNSINSTVVIICDAASLPLFSKSWTKIDADHLPDVFFFSLRKQGLPYDGPQDEAHQARNSGSLYIFNNRALQLAEFVHGTPLYETPIPAEAAKGEITGGDQRLNHIRHLLKLHISLSAFLDDNSRKLDEGDESRQIIAREVQQAFIDNGPLAKQGFELLTKGLAQSQTTYVVKVPENVHPKDIVKSLKDEDIYVSVSMHPKVPNSSYFRFSCYPATTVTEVQIALDGIKRVCL